ncbi:SDR family NAD(P)-dependent oxidoreductase [Mycolicibacterium fluoranthenivorans]
MREHVPALQQSASSDLSRLGSLRTLEDVVGQLRELETPAQAPMAPTKSGHQTTGDTLSRFTVRAVEAPATGYAMRGLGDGPIAITDDGMGVAPRLVRALADRGVAATAVTSGVPADHDGVVFLGGLRAPGSVREALDVQREAFRISKAMAPRFASRPGVFVTVQRTGGDFGLAGTDPTKAWLAGLAGLSRTLQHEWSQVSVKAIDCGFDGADAVAMAIADELTHGGPELDVGLCTGRRITLHTAPMELTSSPHDWLNTDPVIVASGGARGITAAALCALAEKYRCRLLLFGRTPLTGIATDDRADAEIHATINRLQRRGADVRYRAVDIRDAAAVADAVAQARRDWGPITGLVHGAGVLADKLVADKTTQQFDEVFSTKVDGLRALLNATTADPLQLICLFSSVVGHHGNRGQCDYAMANATLTSVAAAEAANRPDCLVRSLGWGPWAGGMVSAPVAELLQARGIPLIAPEAGSQAFVAELEGPRDQVEVMLTATDSAGRVPFLMADQHREAVST